MRQWVSQLTPSLSQQDHRRMLMGPGIHKKTSGCKPGLFPCGTGLPSAVLLLCHWLDPGSLSWCTKVNYELLLIWREKKRVVLLWALSISHGEAEVKILKEQILFMGLKIIKSSTLTIRNLLYITALLSYVDRNWAVAINSVLPKGCRGRRQRRRRQLFCQNKRKLSLKKTQESVCRESSAITM